MLRYCFNQFGRWNQISADNPKHAKVYQQIWKEIFAKYGIDDDDFYDDLETVLISADIGVAATEIIIDDIKQKVKAEKIS